MTDDPMMSRHRPAVDHAVTGLLHTLETSPTDLRKLVLAVRRRPPSILRIAAAAVRRWERDDPTGWAAVRAWLRAVGVTVAIPSDATQGAGRPGTLRARARYGSGTPPGLGP